LHQLFKQHTVARCRNRLEINGEQIRRWAKEVEGRETERWALGDGERRKEDKP
jgi:hypothetical protein